MNTLIDFFDRHLLRIVGTFALMVTYEQMYLHQGWLVVYITSLTFAVFLAMAWIPSQWWTRSSYVAATVFVLGAGFFLYFSQHVSVVGLFWPLVALLGLMPQRWNALSLVLAAVVVISTVLLAYVHPFSLGMTLGLMGTYMGLRNRVIRRETNALRRLHLEELQAAHRELQHAHEELQEVTVQSMQYAALAERTRIARDVHVG